MPQRALLILLLAGGLVATACTEDGGGNDAGDTGWDWLADTGADTADGEEEWGDQCETDEDCDDRVDCTVDTCELGTCENYPDDASCDDGLQCNGDELCDPDSGGCVPSGMFEGCYDGDPCTMDVCIEGEPGMAYTCEHPPLDRDGDGHVDYHCEDGDDCNDMDPGVYPGSGELCFDEKDNDCDELVDADDVDDCSLQNDGCDAPRVIVPGTTTEGFTMGALGDVDSGCDGSSYADVVYEFELTETSDIELQITGRDGFYPYGALQTTCGDSSSTLYCDADSPFRTCFLSMDPGTYTVVVSSWSEGIFDLFLDATPAAGPLEGDDCSSAIDVSAGGTWNGDLYCATDDLQLECASWADYKDLVYTFTTTEPQDVYVRASSPVSSMYASLVTDCSMPSTTSVDCDSDYPFERTWGALPAGTYWLVVESYNPVEFTLDVEFSPPSDPPENDTCAGAVDVSAGGSFAGTLVSASDDGDTSCLGTGYLDAAWVFTIDETRDVQVEVNGTGEYEIYMALQTTCGDETTDVHCENRTPVDHLFRSLDAGTYWIFVESPYQSTYDLDVTFGPPTTACTGIAVITTTGSYSGDNTGLPDDFDPTCGSSGGPDVAYLLSLSETSDVVAEMTSAAFDTLLHVRTDCDDPLSEMVCDDDGAGGSLSRVDFPALPAGDYVLVVDGYGWWSEGTYTLHVDIDSLAPEPTDTADTPDLADIADDPGDGDASAG